MNKAQFKAAAEAKGAQRLADRGCTPAVKDLPDEYLKRAYERMERQRRVQRNNAMEAFEKLIQHLQEDYANMIKLAFPHGQRHGPNSTSWNPTAST